MRLESLTIQNFRSITKAYKLPLSSSTVLIGPNNEGKSNVLRALVLATRMLIGRRRSEPAYAPPRSRFGREADYDWERDFPLHLQEKEPEGDSVFVLEYELTAQEVDEFRSVIGSRLNGTLPLRVAIGTKGTPTVTVHKRGPGGKALSKKAPKIAEFVAERIELEYIPAVRTAVSAQQIVDAMVARELSALEQGQDYIEALQQIAKIQDPVLQELSESIRSTLIQFLPAVKSVDVRAPMERRFEALRRCEIYIDDGSMTELRYKGDGVQSLAALGLMRHASAKSSLGKNVVVAIEEPESHLHPKAIHELRGVVEQLAAKYQVVVTTHCPLFVSRRHVESNIIVNNRKAKAATSVDEIREILGVRAADNLLHAELVLVVEGEDDRTSIAALLAHASTILADALRGNRLTIDTLGGASNLAYKLGLLRDALCECHVFLDSDAAGKQAYERAREARLLVDADVNFANCQGMIEAEFEDLLADELVNQVLATSYRIASSQVPKDARRKKWSRRMELVFGNAGKQWSNRTCSELKLALSEAVKGTPATALHPHRRSVFDALVSALEERLGGADVEASTSTPAQLAAGGAE
jgi:putative ATP-dependent endonuclease of the OLD family